MEQERRRQQEQEKQLEKQRELERQREEERRKEIERREARTCISIMTIGYLHFNGLSMFLLNLEAFLCQPHSF